MTNFRPLAGIKVIYVSKKVDLMLGKLDFRPLAGIKVIYHQPHSIYAAEFPTYFRPLAGIKVIYGGGVQVNTRSLKIISVPLRGLR